MDTSDILADLYFRLEQINRTIAALEHFAQLRAQRHACGRRLPPGVMRDALVDAPRSAAKQCSPAQRRAR